MACMKQEDAYLDMKPKPGKFQEKLQQKLKEAEAEKDLQNKLRPDWLTRKPIAKEDTKQMAQRISEGLTDSELFDLVYNLATIANMKGVHFPGGLNQQVAEETELPIGAIISRAIHNKKWGYGGYFEWTPEEYITGATIKDIINELDKKQK